MPSLAKAVRSHRELNRNRREMNRAINKAGSPALRDELIIVAQRNAGMFYGR